MTVVLVKELESSATVTQRLTHHGAVGDHGEVAVKHVLAWIWWKGRKADLEAATLLNMVDAQQHVQPQK
jgi:hypothetical protein